MIEFEDSQPQLAPILFPVSKIRYLLSLQHGFKTAVITAELK